MLDKELKKEEDRLVRRSIAVAIISAVAAILGAIVPLIFKNYYEVKPIDPPPLEAITKSPPKSCLAPHHSLREMITCAEKDLRPGRLAFEPKKVMLQGQAEMVFVRISPEMHSEIGRGFKSESPALLKIRVSPLMKTMLDGASDDFIIRRIGEEKKIVKPTYTTWTWEVTPLTSGNKLLVVSAYAELILPNGDHEVYEAFMGSAVIQVYAKPSYVIGRFIKNNQWLLGSPLLLGLIGWLWTRLRKEKRKPAGFRL